MKLLVASLLVAAVWGGCFDYPNTFTDPFVPRFDVIDCSRLTLFTYETPMQARLSLGVGALGVNCLSIYSDLVLDAETFEEPIVRSPNTPDTRSTEAVALCYLYGWMYYWQTDMPGAYQPCLDVLNNVWDLNVPDVHPGIVQCEEDFEDDFDGRQACYEPIAQAEGWCPGVTGSIVARELYNIGKRDGWNAYGFQKTEDEECTANCRNYYDYTEWNQRYFSGELFGQYGGGDSSDSLVFSSDDIRGDPDNLWIPLLEDDSLGYFTRQEHVSPQLAVAVPKLVPRGVIDQAAEDLPAPDYDYRADAEDVISTLNDLFVDYNGKRRKDIIFYMDNKSWASASMINALRFNPTVPWSFEEHLYFVWLTNAGKNDAIIAAWTAKLQWSLIRPTTVIQRWGDEQITTWGGPYQPTGVTMAARDFESYVRVMPHSEYPSASACLCETLKDIGRGYLSRNKGLTDIPVTTLPPLFPGTSTSEPGVEPPGPDPTFMDFDSIEEFYDICGESRLWGAMHFYDSVPAGRSLCAGFGDIILDVGEDVLNGHVFNSV